MENQTSSKRIILNYGLYLAIIGILIHLSLFVTDSLLQLMWLTGVLGFVIMIICIVLGIKKCKQNNKGYLTFGQALKIGVGIAVVSAVISAIYTLLFIKVIDPTFQEQAMELQVQKWLDAGMSEEQIDASLAIAKKFQNPAIASAVSIMFSAFFGFIISAITGAIMRKTEENNY